MITPTDWKDYALLDSGDGMKLERWGKFTLARPDPVALWPRALTTSAWQGADGTYARSKTGGGKWRMADSLLPMAKNGWQVAYKDLKFFVRPTSFKHVGLFPEQAVNWSWLGEQLMAYSKWPIANDHTPSTIRHRQKVLNLFAYTGAATIACAKAGAEVTHVDSAKGMVEWASENAKLNGVDARWIVDDVVKFVEREKRRGNIYDGIMMDPPTYGRGTTGETWKIEEHLWPLVKSCAGILSEDPLFFVINSYTAGLSPTVMENVLRAALGSRGKYESFELGIGVLPAGATARWSS